MRTKTLLLTAALSAVAVASSMAQAVYSVNIVGYINLNLAPGLHMIANQLVAPDMTIGALMSAPPNETQIQKFDPASGGYLAATFSDGAWDVPGITLEPGEGAFINVPTAATVTFVGEVKLTSTLPIGAPHGTVAFNGLQQISPVVPQAGLLATDLGFTPVNGDQVFRFNHTSGGYDSYNYTDGDWDVQPSIDVGESFFLQTGPGHPSWTRNFPVGP